MENQSDSRKIPAGTLHVGKPNIGNREAFLGRVNDMLDRRWLTNNGPYAQELEERISERLEVKYCVVVCNGTMALEIAIRALGMTGEVILPSSPIIDRRNIGCPPLLVHSRDFWSELIAEFG
jgi:dTDP-4-amino-4,6-dideoxygalactose transaminase